VDKTQIHPTPAVHAAADALEDSIRRFLAAGETVPPWGKWEAIIEAYLMLGLAIRNIEGVITLARVDLVLLPGAMIMARVAFETGVTVRWMLEPEDPFDREMRWLRTHYMRVKFYQDLARKASAMRRDGSAHVHTADYLAGFHDKVFEQLPQRYRSRYQPKELPNTSQMLECLGEKDQYLHYMVASQYAHGTQEATALYRRNLGMNMEIGEFVTPAHWVHPLYLCWHSLLRAGRCFLERSGGDPDAFAPTDFERSVFQIVTKVDNAVA
jgi:hypothetical protein